MVSCGKLARLIIGSSALVALAAVLFIDFLPVFFGGYAEQRFVLVFISGLLVVLPASLSVFRVCLLPPSLLGVLISSASLCLAFLVLAFPYRSQSYVWVEPGMYAFFFLATVISGVWISVSGSTDRLIIFLLILIAAACGLYGMATINIYLFAISDRVGNLVNFIPWGFVNIRYWSHVATWCLPLMPLVLLAGPFKEYRLWRFFIFLSAGLWWWILILTASRGSVLGIAFGATVILLLFGKRAFPWLKASLGFLAVGIAIWLLLSVVIPSLITGGVEVRSIKIDGSGRMPLFVEAWAMSLRNFPFGMGPQSWLTHDIMTEVYAKGPYFGHPHNMYLMWAAEYGWILMALLGVVGVQAIWCLWNKRQVLISEGKTEKLVILIGITASVSAALFHGGVSAVFMAPGSMLIGLFVMIAFWATILPDRGSGQLSDGCVSSSFVWRAIMATACITLVALWFLWMGEVWIYFEDMQQDELTYHEEVGDGILPRFWFHGNFPRSP